MDFKSVSIGLDGKGACIKTGEAVEIRAGGADIWGKRDELMFTVPSIPAILRLSPG